ncbi:energy transducer TonB [Psychroserpens luteus]|uniref:Energy transducer TonB n=1 Tax=Psychroserpens luteus TaxID=1434066 RepID=A0ABW5ZR83_9FLAO|nr:energy transducer TonB [Psychroserpens luteus]
MKDFNKSHDIAGQSNINVQKSHKHDANLQKNSSLYFQIGLILCLLGTYALFEMKFETKDFKVALLEPLNTDDYTVDVPPFVVEPDAPKQQPVKKVRKQVITSTIKIVDDLDKTPPVDIVTTPIVVSKPLNPDTIGKNEKPVEIPEVFDLRGVEIVPVYPGCEKMTSNSERIKCMNEKITKLVQRKFDTDLAGELGLSGTQRINVQFKIDKNGNVTEILTRAPHPSLEKEAERVTNKIPKMEPGLQRKQPVSVIYNLPIVFRVN